MEVLKFILLPFVWTAAFSPPISIILWIVSLVIADSKVDVLKSFAAGFGLFSLMSILFIVWIETNDIIGFNSIGYIFGGAILLANSILIYSIFFFFYFRKNRKEKFIIPSNTDILDADLNFSDLEKEDE